MKIRLGLMLVLAACALFASSCGKPGPGNVLVVTDGGLPNAMLIPGMDAWESSPWSGTDVHWLPYGPHEQLQVHHGLGRMPIAVVTYISFVDTGLDPSQAAGDLARLVDVTDQEVTVWNDTNGSYFARIVVF
jgi:hypothetical protein